MIIRKTTLFVHIYPPYFLAFIYVFFPRITSTSLPLPSRKAFDHRLVWEQSSALVSTAQQMIQRKPLLLARLEPLTALAGRRKRRSNSGRLFPVFSSG